MYGTSRLQQSRSSPRIRPRMTVQCSVAIERRLILTRHTPRVSQTRRSIFGNKLQQFLADCYAHKHFDTEAAADEKYVPNV